MAKSSINFAKATKGAFRHNDRSEEPDYLLPKEYRLKNEVDLTAKEAEEKIQFLYDEAKQNHIERTGQKLQSTSYRWEAVINLNKEHTLEDVKKLTRDLEKETGFTSVQIAIHRDEGRIVKDKSNKDVPIYNFHAHVTFFTLDRETGTNLYRKDITKRDRNKIEKEILSKYNIEKGEAKSIQRKEFNKLVKDEIKKRGLKVMNSKRLSELQTLTAESLGMERGKVSVKEEAERLGVEHDKNPSQRLEHKQYKQVQKDKELIKLKELKEKLKDAREELKDRGAKREDYAKLEQLSKALHAERKDKNLTKDKLALALKEITQLKTNAKEIQKTNTEIKTDLNNSKDKLKQLNTKYEDLQKEHSTLKAKYNNLKQFVKELPNKLLENAKNTYKEIIEKIADFKQEKTHQEKDLEKTKRLEELYKKKEELQKKHNNNEHERKK